MIRMLCFGVSVFAVGGIAVSTLYNPAKNLERQAVDHTHWFDLSDGRRLAYCTYGPDNGKPVFALR